MREDVDRLYERLEAAEQTIIELKQALSFDWDLLKATQQSLREHQKIIKDASELNRYRVVPHSPNVGFRLKSIPKDEWDVGTVVLNDDLQEIIGSK